MEEEVQFSRRYGRNSRKSGRNSRKKSSGNRPVVSVIKILGNIIFACLTIVIAFLVFFLVQSRLSGQPPAVAGHQMYIVLSGSMSPAFDTGSLVLVKPVDPETITEGDIITFRGTGTSTTMLTHRVIGVNKEGDLSFYTRGDANQVDDPIPVAARNVIGRVSFAIPYAGYVMDFARTKKGLLTIVIIPGIFVIILELRNLFRYAVKEEARKKAEIQK
ncbi:MAG: signal peptidase I [Dethiobacter sp.]|jgi:signal peptidase|nr:signal peptidase I [Dethiobacter sp.]